MPPSTDLTHNPFDFRRPARGLPSRLGASRLGRYVDEAFDSLERGSPMHAFVTGSRRIGKTSALNHLAAEAGRRGFLPILFPLADAVLESSGLFFQSIFRLALESSPWLESAAPDLPTIEALGVPAVVLGVADTLTKAAREAGCAGYVVLIDRAELFQDDDDIFQILTDLLEGADRWMFVIAGRPTFLSEIDNVYPALRGKARTVRLKPLPSEAHTMLFLIEQIIEAPESRRYLNPRALAEFHQASGGQPLLLTALAHYAWRYTDDDQAIQLSTRAIMATLRDLSNLGGLDETIGETPSGLSHARCWA